MTFPFFRQQEIPPIQPLEHPREARGEAVNPILDLNQRLSLVEIQLAELRCLLLEKDYKGQNRLSSFGRKVKRFSV